MTRGILPNSLDSYVGVPSETSPLCVGHSGFTPVGDVVVPAIVVQQSYLIRKVLERETKVETVQGIANILLAHQRDLKTAFDRFVQ